MHYVVMDLEWNQAMSSKSSVFNKLPIHLRGEIIEIGAVKLNEDMTPGEEFKIDVKPVYFKRMHYKVKKLTGFDRERLAAGVSFPEALAQFRAWCGDDVTFLTWGCDDQASSSRTSSSTIWTGTGSPAGSTSSSSTTSRPTATATRNRSPRRWSTLPSNRRASRTTRSATRTTLRSCART